MTTSLASVGLRVSSLCIVHLVTNRSRSISWPEVVKGIQNRGVVYFVSYGSFICFTFVLWMYVVLCFIVFGCQYQCSWLPGKTRLWNDRLCVKWDVKPYTLSPSPTHSSSSSCHISLPCISALLYSKLIEINRELVNTAVVPSCRHQAL